MIRLWRNQNPHSSRYSYFRKKFDSSLKLNIPFDTVMSHIGKYLSNKTKCQHKTCTQMFIAVLFILAKKKKQPSGHQLMMDKQMWCIHTMKYYLTVKRGELLIDATA